MIEIEVLIAIVLFLALQLVYAWLEIRELRDKYYDFEMELAECKHQINELRGNNNDQHSNLF